MKIYNKSNSTITIDDRPIRSNTVETFSIIRDKAKVERLSAIGLIETYTEKVKVEKPKNKQPRKNDKSTINIDVNIETDSAMSDESSTVTNNSEILGDDE